MLHNLNFNELHNFIHIVQAGSFTQAAAKLGVTPSALSQNIKNLEAQLGLRLLNRTTRSISPTEAGEKLLADIAPHFYAISGCLKDLDAWRDTPQGIIRINTSELAAQEILYPKLKPFLQQNPQVKLELMIENRWVDIVAEGFDMGVRLGYAVYQDMISVQISPPFKMILVAAPDYIQAAKPIEKIEDLSQHILIAGRFSSHQDVDAWEFNVRGETIRFAPNARFLSNAQLQQQAAKDGLGIAWLAHDWVQQDLANGSLLELLPHTAKTYEPFYLYYPNRRGNSKWFQKVVDLLRV